MPLRSLFALLGLAFVLAAPEVRAQDEDTTRRYGDYASTGLTLAAFGMTYLKDDKDGRTQYFWNLGTELVFNTTLRGAFEFSEMGERPNGKGFGFPSGHVGLVWSQATFLSRRYGLQYGIPAYAAAAYVGYARWDGNHHYVRDMVFAAAVSQLVGYWTVTNKDDEAHLKPMIGADGDVVGLVYERPWT